MTQKKGFKDRDQFEAPDGNNVEPVGGQAGAENDQASDENL